MGLALLPLVALAPPWEGAMVAASCQSDLVTSEGRLTTGTHLYRPLGRRSGGLRGASGQIQPKVGCVRGFYRSESWVFTRQLGVGPVGMVAGDAVTGIGHLQRQGLPAADIDRNRHRRR